MYMYSDDCEEVPQKLSSETSENEFYRGEIQPLEKPSPSHATPRTQPVRNRTIHIL